MAHKHRPQERLADGELPPPAVAWLHPFELLRTAYHAWLSETATSFIDRREVLAALDPEPPPPEAPPDGSESTDEPSSDPFFGSTNHRSDGVWIDFVADVGDSWEATHAVATLIAQRELKVRGRGRDEPLPHADLVVLGGDLVYPSPTRDSYSRRTREPIGSAFPEPEAPPPRRTPKPEVPPSISEPEPQAQPEPEPELQIRERRLVAIPGNHDWYDGLTSFVREFCQGGWLGGWQLVQKRSYFALKLMPGWWVWGIDIALDTRIDPAQQRYFLTVLSNPKGSRHPKFAKGDRVIVCTAKPSWLRSSRYSDDAYQNLEFFVRELIESHGGRVAMILSGDLHHYSRYASEDGHQLITCGSGGSYLMGTHHLPAEVRPFKRRPEPDQPDSFSFAGFVRSGFSYPSQSDSRRLALRAILLAFRRANIPFCVTLGLISLWLARMIDRVAPGLTAQPIAERFAPTELRLSMLAVLSVLVVTAGCGWFAASANRRIKWWLTFPWGVLHGLAHITVAVLLALLLMPHPLDTIGGPASPYLMLAPPFELIAEQLSMVADAIVFVLIAGWIGATLAGVYLTFSDRVLRWHQNEVFVAQSIFDYRSFVRIHLRPNGHLKIYPIGLRHVPRSWRSRLVRTKSDPHYEPTDAVLIPHLIEGPIDVEVSQAGWPSGAVPAPASKSLESLG